LVKRPILEVVVVGKAAVELLNIPLETCTPEIGVGKTITFCNN
jgi:hypothetical protein